MNFFTLYNFCPVLSCNLPTAPQQQTALDIDSQAVLKSIEGQHGLLVERARGIYSFSHLTFQEYFTARKIATISNPDHLQTALINLTSHVTEKRWREVFLLTAGILEPADRLLLLMKKNIDKLIADESAIQTLLTWARDKSNFVKADYKIAAIRAFYLARAFDLTLAFDRALDRALDLTLALDRALDLTLARAFDRTLALDLDRALDPDFAFDLDLTRAHALAFNLPFDVACAHALALDLDRALALTHARALARVLDQAIEKCADREFKKILEKLQQQLPNRDEDREKWQQWWKNNGAAWTEELRKATIKYRNIGHQRKFNQEQIDLLNKYLAANQLLVDCLHSECYVSLEVRKEIENTLLLPWGDLYSDLDQYK